MKMTKIFWGSFFMGFSPQFHQAWPAQVFLRRRASTNNKLNGGGK